MRSWLQKRRWLLGVAAVLCLTLACLYPFIDETIFMLRLRGIARVTIVNRGQLPIPQRRVIEQCVENWVYETVIICSMYGDSKTIWGRTIDVSGLAVNERLNALVRASKHFETSFMVMPIHGDVAVYCSETVYEHLVAGKHYELEIKGGGRPGENGFEIMENYVLELKEFDQTK